MFRRKIPQVCFYLCSTERNSESLLLVSFHGMEFREFYIPWNSQNPSEQPICFVYSVFRGIIFCQKIPTLAESKRSGPLQYYNYKQQVLHKDHIPHYHINCSPCLLHAGTSCGSNVDDAIFSYKMHFDGEIVPFPYYDYLTKCRRVLSATSRACNMGKYLCNAA